MNRSQAENGSDECLIDGLQINSISDEGDEEDQPTQGERIDQSEASIAHGGQICADSSAAIDAERARVREYIEAFGPEGARFCSEGKSMQQARQELLDGQLKEALAERARLLAEIEELDERLRQVGIDPAEALAEAAEQLTDAMKSPTRKPFKPGDNLARFAAGIKIPSEPSE